MDTINSPQVDSQDSTVGQFGLFASSAAFLGKVLPPQGIIVSQGFGSEKEASSKETIALASLGYEIFAYKRFYQEAREHLLTQLFRSVSRSLFKSGGRLSASLTALLFSERYWWFATTGDERMYRFRQNELVKLFPRDESVVPREVVRMGGQKFVEPTLSLQGDIKSGDIFLVMTHDAAITVNEKKMIELLSLGKKLQLPFGEIAKTIVAEAQKRRKEGEYGVGIVEKD